METAFSSSTVKFNLGLSRGRGRPPLLLAGLYIWASASMPWRDYLSSAVRVHVAQCFAKGHGNSRPHPAVSLRVTANLFPS